MKAKFDWNLEELGFFLVQVAEFLCKWRLTFPEEASCVNYFGSTLEGLATKWYVTLYLMQGA